MSQVELSGWGAAGRLGEILDRRAVRTVFLVSGKSSFSRSGAAAALAPALASRRVVRFDDFAPNPTAEQVRRGVASLRNRGAEIVIAVGGGSAIDLAKLINACAIHGGDASDYLTGRSKLVEPGLPLIAVPTTAGSGAEATHFATVYIAGIKHSVASPRLLPEVVVLDPSLTRSMPAALAASSGLDALAQGIESYWSVAATEPSRSWARSAVERAARHLPGAVAGGAGDDREQMMVAANLAGKAINVSRTTAPHAMSYALTIGFGIPHGHAVGLTLASVFDYNAGVTDGDVVHPMGATFVRDRLAEIAAALGAESPAAASARLRQLMVELGLETRLRALGVDRADLESLVRSVNVERLSNNPRRFSAAGIGRILDSVF